MKKVKFEKKLSLKKETVAKLIDANMNRVKGGISPLPDPQLIQQHKEQLQLAA